MQHAIAHGWGNFCWFADFGAHHRIPHVLGALCPLLLTALGLLWLFEHLPLVWGDVGRSLWMVPLAWRARQRAL